jgi:hypothetical protein
MTDKYRIQQLEKTLKEFRTIKLQYVDLDLTERIHDMLLNDSESVNLTVGHIVDSLKFLTMCIIDNVLNMHDQYMLDKEAEDLI